MKRISGVFNTNSFEVVIATVDRDRTTSLRGLYPIGALQNHCCVPNTRHHFDDRQRMYVSAAMPIASGEELVMSYTDLLWDTLRRRQFLRATKFFSCYCSRCSDPSVRPIFSSQSRARNVHARRCVCPRNSDLGSVRFSARRTIARDICYPAIISIAALPGSATRVGSA